MISIHVTSLRVFSIAACQIENLYGSELHRYYKEDMENVKSEEVKSLLLERKMMIMTMMTNKIKKNSGRFGVVGDI